MFSRVVAFMKRSTVAIAVVSVVAVAGTIPLSATATCPVPPVHRYPNWGDLPEKRVHPCVDDCFGWIYDESEPAPKVTFEDLIAAGDVCALEQCAKSRHWNENEWGDRIALSHAIHDCMHGIDKKDRLKVPVRIAVQHNRLEMLKLLYAHGCVVEDEMPLHIARDNEFHEIVQFLHLVSKK